MNISGKLHPEGLLYIDILNTLIWILLNMIAVNIVVNVQVIKLAGRTKEKASSLGLVDTLGKELIVIISMKRCGHVIFHKLNCFFFTWNS